MRNLFFKSFLLIFVLVLSTQLRAQDSASVTGVVTDPTGAVLPGTVVTLSNPSTGVTFTQTTDNIGSFRFANVPPTTGYKATFTHPGFATEEVSGITLAVGVTRTQDAKLHPAGSNEQVEVSAESQEVTLNTSDAAIGNNIDVEQLNLLPVYDRTTGIATLFMQQPGVDSFQGAVTGARIDQNEVTLDGLDVNDIAAGTTFAIVGNAPVDSVEQFTGTVAGLTPVTGTGSGAQFQMVTKSGTNKFHGNVNEYHRDTTTVANTWFNNLVGIPRTPLIQNQFGGAIGGPIKRDKLFFFFDWADSRIVQSSSDERTVPLPASMGGLLAGTVNYINSSDATCGDSSRINTQPSCITTTLSSTSLTALDPAHTGLSQSVLSFIGSRYPVANDLSQGDGVNTGGYRFTFPNPDNRATYVSKVDYNLTPTQRIFGRFTITRRNAIESGPEFPTDPVTHPRTDDSYGYVVSHVWTIGKNKVNQFYYGDNISKLSFPDTYNPTGANQYSFSGLDGPYTSYDGQKRRIPIPVVRDDFNWQKGMHSLTFGGTFKFVKTDSNLINNFNFVGAGLQGPLAASGLSASERPSDINQGSNQVAANDWDNIFATGLGMIGQIVTNYNYNNKGVSQPAGSGGPKNYRFFQTEAYFGDTWRVNKKLTLSYGVRYQYYSVPFETHGNQSVASPIDLTTFINKRLAQSQTGDSSNTGLPFWSYSLGGKANHGPNLYAPITKDFAPRFAFSYAPYNSRKTVINGSAGLVFDRTVIDAIDFLEDQISYLFSNQQINNLGLGLVGNPRLGSGLAFDQTLIPAPQAIASPLTPYVDSTGTPYGLAAGQTSFQVDPKLKDPYSIALSFGVQQDLPGHMVMKLNYVGRLGRRLLADADANQVIDVPDFTGGSTQSMAGAFAGLAKELRAGQPITAQPWFEDVLPAYGTAIGFNNNTELVDAMAHNYALRGDIADALYFMAYYSYYGGFTGFLPTNIGIPSQFGTNAYLTNKGNSNYNGLLFTLDKNLSQGVRFQFNYTWSHSIDNTSESANSNALFSNSGMICDILQPRACRGDSDFDVRQEINSNFGIDLPFGRGKMFARNAPRVLDEAIGGWSLSGLPSYRTGLTVVPYSDAYLASFDNIDPAIFIGNKSDLKTKVNVDRSSGTVYGFAGGAAGAAKVLAEFRGPLGLEYGQRNIVRGPGAFFLDAGLGKTFPIIEDKLNLNFRADAFNVLNHPNFGPEQMNIVTNASNFGQITGTNAAPDTLAVPADNARVAQFSLRLEF